MGCWLGQELALTPAEPSARKAWSRPPSLYQALGCEVKSLFF